MCCAGKDDMEVKSGAAGTGSGSAGSAGSGSAAAAPASAAMQVDQTSAYRTSVNFVTTLMTTKAEDFAIEGPCFALLFVFVCLLCVV